MDISVYKKEVQRMRQVCLKSGEGGAVEVVHLCGDVPLALKRSGTFCIYFHFEL